jgi:hypothetical protein
MARAKLAIPNPAATVWEVGVVGVCICIAELVAEGLRCDAGEDEIAFLIAIIDSESLMVPSI